MYLGHLAAGFALKAGVRDAPLSWLLLATVASDLVCGALVMLGAESLVIHGTLVFAHAHATIGYSHSLVSTLALASVLGVTATRYFRSWRIGAAVGGAVASHFVLDALSHLPDMPVLGFGAAHDLVLGTSLAAHPLAHFLVELALCLVAWWLFDRCNRRLLITLLGLMAMYSNLLFGFIALPAASSQVLGASMIATFLFTPAVLVWAGRTSHH